MCTILVRDFEVLDYAENRVFHSLAYRCLDERHRTYSPDAKTRVDAYIAINCSKKMAFILIQTFLSFNKCHEPVTGGSSRVGKMRAVTALIMTWSQA